MTTTTEKTARPAGMLVAPAMPLREVERLHIMQTLSYFDGNKTRTARALEIDTKTLYNKLKGYEAVAAAAASASAR